MSDEHYIYQTNSVDIVDASDFDLRSQIDRYVQYTSLDACNGWDGPGYSEPASCEVTLTVMDDAGAAAQDTVTFSLSQTDNSDPVVIYSPDKTEASEGETISFDATSTYDVDGDDLGFTWDFGDGDSATGDSVTYSYVDAGSYTVSLSVTDGKTTVTPDSVDITISAGVRPSATISDPNDGSTLNLGEQTTLSGTGSAPAGSTITELVWDLGIRTTPWGEVELSNGLFVCDSSNGAGSCGFGEFETIDSSSEVGTPCSCDDTYPYKEFNIYPSSLVSLSSEQPMLVSYSSFSQCSDYKQTDIICDISLITKDNVGRYSPKETIQLTLSGLPGDLNADAELSQEDSNIIYNYIVGQIQEVQGNPDCDGDGVATINDFVLIEDVLTGEIESCPGGESSG